MRKILLFSFVFSFANFAGASSKTIKWVGQLPADQAASVVEMFNQEQAQKAGFTVQYHSDDQAINDTLEGTVHNQYDLIHLKDAEMLHSLSVKNLITPMQASSISAAPSHLKDSNSNWVGILKRSRIIYYNSDFVSAGEIPSYESLGQEKFKDKLCVRQKKAQYTASLHAFFVGVWGPEKTEQVLGSWAANTENVPLIEKDLDGVIAAIEKGDCWVGVANTYYFMRHLKANPETKVKALSPNQNDIGAHVNVDGVAVLKASSNQKEAEVFAQWLLSEKAQLELSSVTNKHPVNPQAIPADLNRAFPELKDNTTFDLNRIFDLKAIASDIADNVGLK